MDLTSVLPAWTSIPRKPSTADDPTANASTTKPTNTNANANANANDSDNDTASAASSDMSSGHNQSQSQSHGHGHGTDAAAARLQGVGASLARVGKRFWDRQVSLQSSFRQKHARSVSDFSESDFAPLAVDTPVWTRFGLGSVMHQREDGVTVVALQGALAKRSLFVRAGEEDLFAVPAIRHDWVETPAGEGRVVAFSPVDQCYTIHLRDDDMDARVHRTEVKRVMPVRRRTSAAPQHVKALLFKPRSLSDGRAAGVAETGVAEGDGSAPSPSASAASTAKTAAALQKGFNSAFQTLAKTSSGLSNSTYQMVSNYYYQGQCVVTSFGDGQIVSIDQAQHRAQVELTTGGLAHVNLNAILFYVKALPGMEVTTKFGVGEVTHVRGQEAMYTVRLHERAEGDAEVVYVHESDLVRGRSRLRLGSANKQVRNRLASTSKLFSSYAASGKAKIFGAKDAAGAGAVAGASTHSSPHRSPRETTAATATTRSKSVRVVEPSDSEGDEPHQEPSSAGI